MTERLSLGLIFLVLKYEFKFWVDIFVLTWNSCSNKHQAQGLWFGII